jgi:UDP-glucose 4-epimerase
MYAAAIPIFLRRMIENRLVTVFGGRGQTRDFVFIDDVVRANSMAVAHPAAAGEIFNMCSEYKTSVLDFLNVIHEPFPSAPDHLFDEPRVVDIYKSLKSAELAEHVIGFKAQTDLVSGLKKTADWMCSFHK